MWYVLQVAGNKEERIRDDLISKGYQALVPCENRLIRSKGSWIKKKYIIFPNYVFVKLDKYKAEHYYKITNIEGVARFLGDKRNPSTLTFLESEWIRVLGANGIIEPTKVEVVNGNLKVVKGVLENFKSRFKSFDLRHKKAEFEITICNEIKKITLSIEVINTDEQDIEDD